MKTQNQQAVAILATYRTTPNPAAAALAIAAAMAVDYQTAAVLVAAILGA